MFYLSVVDKYAPYKRLRVKDRSNLCSMHALSERFHEINLTWAKTRLADFYCDW
jgi:hypothetical protein